MIGWDVCSGLDQHGAVAEKTTSKSKTHDIELIDFF